VAAQIATSLLGALPKPRQASFRSFFDASGTILDEGLVLYFPAPHSFTGEDVIEFQGHGGPVVLSLILDRVVALGARLAEPGEFSQRAFLNGKLDLAQAEAVADLIAASTNEGARAAMRSLEGEFSRRVHTLVDGLTELRMFVESAIDFPEEEIDFLSDGNVDARLAFLGGLLTELDRAASQGRILRDGMTVAIAGPTNAGKSSLLNRLSGRDVAIVTEIPGTTRDVLREYISIDGMPLHIIDTAGLRDSRDPVEQEGIRRAWIEIQTADRVLLMIDDCRGVTDEERRLHARLPVPEDVIVIVNKIDLTGRPSGVQQGPWGPEISLSAKSGEGVDMLCRHLKECMGFNSTGEGGFMARRRHLQAIERAGASLERARYQLKVMHAGELMAEELRIAQAALSEITGEFTSDDLLGEIFSSFCVGK
jgi:tRNA modification GTPase